MLSDINKGVNHKQVNLICDESLARVNYNELQDLHEIVNVPFLTGWHESIYCLIKK